MNIVKSIQDKVISSIKKEADNDEKRKENTEKIRAAVNPEEVEEEVIESNIIMDYYKEAMYESSVPTEEAFKSVVVSYTVVEALSQLGIISADPVKALRHLDNQYYEAMTDKPKSKEAIAKLVEKANVASIRVKKTLEKSTTDTRVANLDDVLFTSLRSAVIGGATIVILGPCLETAIILTAAIVSATRKTSRYATTKQRYEILLKRKRKLEEDIRKENNKAVKDELVKFKQTVEEQIHTMENAMADNKKASDAVKLESGNVFDKMKKSRHKISQPLGLHMEGAVPVTGLSVLNKRISDMIKKNGKFVTDFNTSKAIKSLKDIPNLAERKHRIKEISKSVNEANKKIVSEFNKIVKSDKNLNIKSAALEQYFKKAHNIVDKVVTADVSIPLAETKKVIADFNKSVAGINGKVKSKILQITSGKRGR